FLSGNQEATKKPQRYSWIHCLQIHSLFITSNLKHLTSNILSYPLRYDFSRGLHVLGGCAVVKSCCPVAGNCPGKRAALEHAVQNFFHPKGKTVGFRDALD